MKRYFYKLLFIVWSIFPRHYKYTIFGNNKFVELIWLGKVYRHRLPDNWDRNWVDRNDFI